MEENPSVQTQKLADRLRAQGHAEPADHLERQIGAHPVEHGLLFALREACETVLTAIEAIDPATQAMIENLRLGVEKRLDMPIDHSGKPPSS